VRRALLTAALAGAFPLAACTKLEGLPDDALAPLVDRPDATETDAVDAASDAAADDGPPAARCFESGTAHSGTFTADSPGVVWTPAAGRPVLNISGAAPDGEGGYFLFGSQSASTERGVADAVVARFDARGAVVRTWGDAGSVAVDTTDAPSGPRADTFRVGALDGEGRLVAAGFSYGVNTGRHAGLVLRLLPDGRRDPTFGEAGVASITGGASTFTAHDLLLDARGILLVGDDREGGQGTQGMVTRLRADGSRDPAFGRSGLWSSGAVTSLRSVLADGDGYLIAGVDTATRRVALLRLRGDGVPDASFGASGLAPHPGGARSSPSAMERRPDGRVVVLAETRYSNSFEGVQTLLGFTARGAPDPGFGAGGVVAPREGGILHYASSRYALALLCDGSALSFTRARSTAVLLQRFAPDGREDASFGDESRAVWGVPDVMGANVPVAVLAEPGHGAVTALTTTTAGHLGIYRVAQ